MAERFYFEKPTAARKADIVEYLNEFAAAGSEINGSGSLDRISVRLGMTLGFGLPSSEKNL